jgi:hypothetical protein
MAPQNGILSRPRCNTNVPQNFRGKQSTKPVRDLIFTPSKTALDGKEVIHVLEYDHKFRELIVPSLQSTADPALLNIHEFNRIKRHAKVSITIKN